MDIILFFNSRKRRLQFSLGRAGLSLVSLGFCVLACGLFYLGSEYAALRTEDMLRTIRAQTGSIWQDELAAQERALQEVKKQSQQSLDAMATRLSLLQGHVMRLDALGSRLADMAHLDDMDFSVDSPPGMGGPANSLQEQSYDIPDFLKTLDDIEVHLRDRAEKLTAMESMLMDRSLQEQTSPGGTPAPSGWISSLYGLRTDPVTGKKEFHQGIDFAGRPESPVTAVAAGIVTWAGPRFGYGNLVEISHGSGFLTRYAHNKKLLVSVGEKVEKGEIVALMGSSGRSTGTHVHFEVVRYGQHVDPRRYVGLK